MISVSTIGKAALAVAGFIALTVITGIISANVRVWAAALGWDQNLLRAWLALPPGLRSMLQAIPSYLGRWQPLRQLWWLWLVLGLSGGLGVALTIVDGAEPSPILRLDDGKRWQFLKYFQDQKSPPEYRPLTKCEAAVSIKPNSTSAWELWDELQPLLSYGIWTQFGGGPGDSLYPNGLTIFTASHQGAPFVCASRLAQWINTQTPIRAELVQQPTPILEQCKNECVEIHVGAAR